MLVGGKDGSLHALDPRTGTEAWAAPVKGGFGPPFVGRDGQVYLPQQGNLATFDLKTRSVVENTPLQHGFEDTPVVGPDGTVYGGGHDGSIYALEPGTGKVKWACPTGGMVRNSPVVGPDGVGCSDSYVYALDPATGKEKWKFDAKREVRVSPTVGKDGLLYVVSDANTVFAVSQSNGVEVYKSPAKSYIHCPPAVDSRGGFFYGCNDHTLVAGYDPVTEREIELQESAFARPGDAPAERDPTIEHGDGWIRIDGVRLQPRQA